MIFGKVLPNLVDLSNYGLNPTTTTTTTTTTTGTQHQDLRVFPQESRM
jgi:hypothetical protein